MLGIDFSSQLFLKLQFSSLTQKKFLISGHAICFLFSYSPNIEIESKITRTRLELMFILLNVLYTLFKTNYSQ